MLERRGGRPGCLPSNSPGLTMAPGPPAPFDRHRLGLGARQSATESSVRGSPPKNRPKGASYEGARPPDRRCRHRRNRRVHRPPASENLLRLEDLPRPRNARAGRRARRPPAKPPSRPPRPKPRQPRRLARRRGEEDDPLLCFWLSGTNCGFGKSSDAESIAVSCCAPMPPFAAEVITNTRTIITWCHSMAGCATAIWSQQRLALLRRVPSQRIAKPAFSAPIVPMRKIGGSCEGPTGSTRLPIPLLPGRALRLVGFRQGCGRLRRRRCWPLREQEGAPTPPAHPAHSEQALGVAAKPPRALSRSSRECVTHGVHSVHGLVEPDHISHAGEGQLGCGQGVRGSCGVALLAGRLHQPADGVAHQARTARRWRWPRRPGTASACRPAAHRRVAAMADAAPTSAWQPPSAPATVAFRMMSMPMAPALASPRTSCSSESPQVLGSAMSTAGTTPTSRQSAPQRCAPWRRSSPRRPASRQSPWSEASCPVRFRTARPPTASQPRLR